MKKNFLLLCVALLTLGITRAAEVNVTSDNFADAYSRAQNGDVLLLAPGTYAANMTAPVENSITIKSAQTDPDSVAVLTGSVVGITAGTAYSNGELIFDGVKIERRGTFFDISTAATGTLGLLAVRNSEVVSIERTFMASDKQTFTLEKFEMTNNIVHNCNDGGWNHIWTAFPIHEMVFENNTYYNNAALDSNGDFAVQANGNLSAMESFYNCRANNSEHSFKFIFKNNTLYQPGIKNGSSYPICVIGDNYNVESTYLTFENNIIISPDARFPGFSFAKAGAAMDVIVKNNLIHGYKTDNVPYGAIEIPADNVYGEFVNEPNYTLGSFNFANPAEVFLEPKKGEFTVYDNSPMATAASDGGVIGAKRWLTPAPEMVQLTTGYYTGSDETMGTISGPSGQIPVGREVTLTAVRKFGYKLAKWVDAAGNTLSEDVSYKFTMEAEITVLIVFEQIPTYTLTVNIDGQGAKVLYSSEGQDKKFLYEENEDVTITAMVNPIAEFVIWSDGVNEIERIITMERDIELTATFTTKPFIVGWDWSTLESNTAKRKPDYLGEGVNPYTAPELDVYMSVDGVVTKQAPGGLFAADGSRLTDGRKAIQHWGRRPTDGLPGNDVDGPFADCTKEFFYWQTEVSTKGFGDVTVYYSLNASNYKSHTKYFLQYSVDEGRSWETADTFDTPGSTWVDRDTTIDYTANLDKLILRWMPDTSSPTVRKITGGGGGPEGENWGPGRDVESLAIVDFYILAEGKGPWNSLDTQSVDAVNAYVSEGTLTINGVTNSSEAYLFGIDGRLVAQFTANEGTTIKNFSSLKGIYILRVNEVTTKLIF